MQDLLPTLSYENLFELIVRSLDKMDNRLSGHGERVAYRIMKAAMMKGQFSDHEVCRLTWTVLLHDIGNYQHLDFSDLMECETNTSNSHAHYGYLFLNHFGPYPQEALTVYYHHSSCEKINKSSMNEKLKWISQVLLVADMVDLFLASKPGDKAEGLDEFFEELETDSRYDREAVALVKEIETNLPATREEMHQAIKKQLGKMTITHEEQNAFLKVLISSIDFRSRATALHCTIIVEVADMLAQYCNVSEEEKKEIHLGAILHDLGKIAIPVRTLESNGKLEGEDWEIMKSHIVLTEEILDGIISERIKDIAVRHHETLDGKGYPRGLTEQDLTLPQRILAVADIISALSEERSYKAAFPLDEIVKILEGLCQRGKLAPEVVEVAKLNKDSLHKRAIETGRKAAADYMYISNSLEKSNNV